MADITADKIRKLREETGAPMMRVKKVLEEHSGDVKKASDVLMKEGFEKMAKRADRTTGEGRVIVYQHHTGKVAAMVELLSETDFVAKNELFQGLAADIALQIVSMNPEGEEELLKQEFIKDPSKTIEALINEVKSKTGENIRLGRFHRLAVGE